MFLVSEIFAFELVAVNSPYYQRILVVGSQRVNSSKISNLPKNDVFLPNLAHNDEKEG